MGLVPEGKYKPVKPTAITKTMLPDEKIEGIIAMFFRWLNDYGVSEAATPLEDMGKTIPKEVVAKGEVEAFGYEVARDFRLTKVANEYNYGKDADRSIRVFFELNIRAQVIYEEL